MDRGAIQRWAQQELGVDLDDEQADAVGAIGGDIKVVARAGSGKTRTLVTRALFLQKRHKVAPQELLLLAFNKKAAAEMKERLSEVLGERLPHTMTFHALAYALTHPDESLLYDDENADQLGLSRAIQVVIDELVRAPESRERVREVMLNHFREDWERITEAQVDQPLDEYLAQRRRMPQESLRGEYVKSQGERLIANTLFEYAVPYKYERNHRWNGANYRPDFTLGAADGGIIIEYFGLEGDPDYDKMSAAKRAYWAKKVGWTFFEYSPIDIAKLGRDGFIARFLADLQGRGIELRRRSEEEIWQEVAARAIDRFTGAMKTFVSRCRRRNLTHEGLDALLAGYTPTVTAEAQFLELGSTVYERYLNRLASEHQVDFEGLIWRAVSEVRAGQKRFVRDKGKEQGDISRLRYVLIDEFQDFTPSFYELVKAIRSVNQEVEFFAVGDDWQAINGFAGSETTYFKDFDRYFRGTRECGLATNYRSVQPIVDVGNALMHGRGSPGLAHRADSGLVLLADIADFNPSPVEIARHQQDIITPVLLRVLRRLLGEGRDVVLLSRRNSVPWYVHVEDAESNPAESLGAFVEHIRGFIPEPDRDRVTASTAHRYKGLEQAAVVILDAVKGSYPLVHPTWVFLQVFGDNPRKLEDEERRLLYVAMTRATDTLVLITDEARHSPFISDVGEHSPLTELKWQDHQPFPSLGGAHVEVRVFEAYEVRDQLRQRKFRWQPEGKYWYRAFLADDFVPEALMQEPWMAGGATARVFSEAGELLHIL